MEFDDFCKLQNLYTIVNFMHFLETIETGLEQWEYNDCYYILEKIKANILDKS